MNYPFINRKTTQGDALLERSTFHDLTRRVRLEALSCWHPDTRQRLHRVMANHYQRLLEAEQQPAPVPQAEPSQQAHAEWFAEIPEQQFRAQLEWLYHALQVKEMQAEAFERWQDLTAQAVTRWRRKQAGPLLELVQQLAAEEEPFLHQQSEHFRQYLLLYSRFLAQEARWDDARIVLQEATRVFEQGEHHADQAGCLNDIGIIYNSQGQLDTALDYFKHALALFEQVGSPAEIARSFNNIGYIYGQQGQLDRALDCYQRALALFEQVGNPADIARSLNNIGDIYGQQGQLDRALDYFQRALALVEQVGNPADIARSCHNIASLRLQQEQWQDATRLFLRALSLYERMGRGFESDVADELEKLACCCMQLGESERGVTYTMWAKQIREQLQKS